MGNSAKGAKSMSRWQWLLVLICVGWFSMATAARADEAAEVFAELFSEQLKQVKSTPVKRDDVELAEKMLATARTVEDEDLVILLCDSAYGLTSTSSRGYERAIEAMRLLAERVSGERERCRERMLSTYPRLYANSRGEEKAEAGRALIEMLEEEADKKCEAGELDGAVHALQRARKIAAVVKSDPFGQIKSKLDRVADKRRVETAVKHLRARLEADPKDSEAARKLFRLYAVDIDSPLEASKYASYVDEPTQRNIELANRSDEQLDAEACEELGKWYQTLADEANPIHVGAMLRRAVGYYEQHLALHQDPDLSRTRTELVLGKLKGRLARLERQTVVDLLKLIDPGQDAVIGQWNWVGDKLQCQRAKSARILLPVVVEGSYELCFQFCRLAGKEAIHLVVPVGSRKCLISLGGSRHGSGIGRINGKRFYNNETSVKSFKIRNGVTYNVRVSVELKEDKAKIVTAVNSKPLLRWQGPPSALSTVPPRDEAGRRLRMPGVPALGAGSNQVNFHIVKTRALDGKITPLRG